MPEIADFSFSEEKDKKLKSKRGLGFAEIITCIDGGQVIDIIRHPNQTEYAEQYVYIIDIEEYTWMVSHKELDGKTHLITAFQAGRPRDGTVKWAKNEAR